MDRSLIMKQAHSMARKMVKTDKVNGYRTKLSICLKYIYTNLKRFKNIDKSKKFIKFVTIDGVSKDRTVYYSIREAFLNVLGCECASIGAYEPSLLSTKAWIMENGIITKVMNL